MLQPKTYVAGPHLDAWFGKYPTRHRTDHRGQRIICPKHEHGRYPVIELVHRVKSTSQCHLCGAKLGKPIALTGPDAGESAWPLVA